jgi:cytochrome b6-f complex iron-sulfur subunit
MLKNSITGRNRRQFLQYLVAGASGITAIGWIFPSRTQAGASEEESVCKASEDNLPSVEATDDLGNPIVVDALLANAVPGSRVGVKGLPRQAYLVINSGPEIASYAISAVCSHLRCTVDWVDERSRFICPCHGSEYDPEGKVLQGPAPRPLSLVTVIVKDNRVRLINRPPDAKL